MKTFFLLSFLLATGMSVSAMPMDDAVRCNEPSDMKRAADKLRYELKYETEQRMREVHVQPRRMNAKEKEVQTSDYVNAVPVHTSHQQTLMEEGLTYKERLDSIVSLEDYKLVFTYDDIGNMTTKEQMKWTKGAWAPQTLEVATYNEDRFRTSVISYVYQDTDYVPKEAFYDSYLDEEKNQIIRGYATWNVEHEDWRFQYVCVSELDELGREVSYTYYLDWDDENWRPVNVYEHYEVAYLDDEVSETTWFEYRNNELVPSRKRKAKNDDEHHYTIMYENFVYLNGQWVSREYNEERRWYYGENKWAYLTTYHEYKSGYSTNGVYDYGYKSVYEYDEHQTETLCEYFNWDAAKQGWIGYYHREHIYRYYPTDWGSATMILRSASLDGWNDTYDTWASGYLTEDDYDQNNEWTYKAQATWSAEAKDWVYSYKEKADRIYDEMGRLLLMEQMAWSAETQEWGHPFFSAAYEYADDGMETLTQYNNWSTDLEQWQEGWKTMTRKDERGNIVYEDHNRWDASKQCFVPCHHTEICYIYDDECSVGYMYDGHAEISKVEFSNWNEELGTWDYGKKIESEYDEVYRIIHRLTSYWIPNAKEFYLAEELQQEFDERGQMIEYQIDSYSEDGNKYFEYHEKWSKRYDANDNMVESCSYDYDLNKGKFWMTSRSVYEYDLTTPAQVVMGLSNLEYYKDKPLSYLYQKFSYTTGKEIEHEERYFYYSEVNAGGEGIGQTMVPMTVDVVDGRLSFSSESPADLTVSTLDGKLVDCAKQVRNYSLQLTAGMYLVTVNGVSRMLKI